MDMNNYNTKKDCKENLGELIKYKQNFPFLTLEFKKKSAYKYNLIKLLIFIEKFKKYHMVVKACGPNNLGTAFIFVPIKTEAQFEESFKDIMDFAKRLDLKHSELNFESVKEQRNNV
jgi:Ni,Fe-hydrogenase maturation factor